MRKFIKKETPAKVFSCEFCEMFCYKVIIEPWWVTTSGQRFFSLYRPIIMHVSCKIHFSPASHFYTLWKLQKIKGLKWANYMELFYAMIHVTHPIHWLKLKKTLRKTSVLAYLNCDLLKNKEVCILHYIQNTDDRKCHHFWNYPKFFLEITFQNKNIFYQFF